MDILICWCYLCQEKLQLNLKPKTNHYFVWLIAVSAVVIIDLMVSLLQACVKVSLSKSSHWLLATISALQLADIWDWPADMAFDRMPANLWGWFRLPSPRLTCLSKSPVNCNDCPADWKNPAPFSLTLSLSFCLWVPPACLCISHKLFSVLSSIAECTTMLITFFFWFYSRFLALFSSVTLSCLDAHTLWLLFFPLLLLIVPVCASVVLQRAIGALCCHSGVVSQRLFLPR